MYGEVYPERLTIKISATTGNMNRLTVTKVTNWDHEEGFWCNNSRHNNHLLKLGRKNNANLVRK